MIKHTEGMVEKRYDHHGRDGFIISCSLIRMSMLSETNKCNDTFVFYILSFYHPMFIYNLGHNIDLEIKHMGKKQIRKHLRMKGNKGKKTNLSEKRRQYYSFGFFIGEY
jgi:hypothetical protein